ncbi:MAG: hypothetical protein M3Z29_15115, partial [Pseudomonadota bacterium]|nr:hypothetical protein [Pseudomonadota bacterium]
MRWSERQRAMLREMGLRPWFRDAPDEGGVPDSGDVVVEAPPLERIVAEAPSVYSATPHSTVARTAVATTPPSGGRAGAPASAGAAAAIGQADWLVVGGPFEAAD